MSPVIMVNEKQKIQVCYSIYLSEIVMHTKTCVREYMVNVEGGSKCGM